MKQGALLLSIVLLLGMSTVAVADVVITQTSTMETMGMGGSNIDMTLSIKGDKHYGKIVTAANMPGMPGGGQSMETVTITRLDQGVSWVLNGMSNSYSETNLTELKAETQAQQADMAKMAESADAYEWDVKVDRLGDSDISGFTCQGIKGVATGVKKSNPDEKSRITYEAWFGRDLPGQDEIQAHFDKFMEVSGQDVTMLGGMINTMFADAGPAYAELAGAMAEMKGYPIQITFIIESSMGGTMPGMDTSEMGEEAAAMMKKMQGMMGGKKSEDGMNRVLSMTTTVKTIETTAVDDALFEIPEGYTKQ